MKISLSLAAIATLAATAAAAPLNERSSLACVFHRTAGILSKDDTVANHNLVFGRGNREHKPMIDSNEMERFELLSCEPPSHKYKHGGKGAIYGLVRDNINSSLCITLNSPLPRNISANVAWSLHYSGATLEKCASTDSDLARRQWFKGTKHGHQTYLTHVGFTSDQDRFAVGIKNNYPSIGTDGGRYPAQLRLLH